MNTIHEIIKNSKRLGVHCSASAFWRYVALGILPEGKKIQGRGNVLYFPADIHIRLWLIAFLRDDIGVDPAELQQIPWESLVLPAEKLLARPLPKSGKKRAKATYRELKRTIIFEFVKQLPGLLGSKSGGRKRKSRLKLDGFVRRVRPPLMSAAEMPEKNSAAYVRRIRE